MKLRYVQSQTLSSSSPNQYATIYLRNAKGQAKLANLCTPIASSEIVKEASSRWGIPVPRVMLYYNGLCINDYTAPVNLVENSICHVIDTNNLNTPELQVSFTPPDSKFNTFKIAFLPEATIRDTIVNDIVRRCEIAEEKIFLVYVGRTLNPNFTWKEEMVENGSQIQVMKHRQTEEALKREVLYMSSSYNLLRTNQTSTRQQSPVTFVTSLKEKKRQKQQTTALLQLNSSQIHQAQIHDKNQNQPNFRQTVTNPQTSGQEFVVPHPVLLNESFPSLLPTIVQNDYRDIQNHQDNPLKHIQQPSADKEAHHFDPSHNQEQPSNKKIAMQQSPILNNNNEQARENQANKVVIQIYNEAHQNYPQTQNNMTEPQMIGGHEEDIQRESMSGSKIRKLQS